MQLGGKPIEFEEIQRIVGWIAALATLVAVGFYLIGKIRGGFRQSDGETSFLMTNFREMHSEGQLSDEEYRNIKAKLATQLRDELKQSKQAE